MPTGLRPLVAATADNGADAPPGEGTADARVAQALIANKLHRAAAELPTVSTPDTTAVEKGVEVERFVVLTPGEDQRHWLAAAFGAELELRRESAARAAESLVVLTPTAPAAC